jgi:2-keto-4-pentenoate hydratase
MERVGFVGLGAMGSVMVPRLAGLGEALRPGDLVTCGSVIPPLFLDPGDESVAFHLEGFGAVSVRVRVGDAKRQ